MAISRKKVLQIAYDPVMVGVRRRLLETSGYDVVTVFAAGENLDALDVSALGINVVILDHSAPFEERWSIVRRLKLNYPELPVVALRRDALDEGVSLADHHASAGSPADWLNIIASALA